MDRFDNDNEYNQSKYSPDNNESNKEEHYNDDRQSKDYPLNVQDENDYYQLGSYKDKRTELKNPPPKSKKSWLSGFIGGIIGGLISALVVTLLFTNGTINISQDEENDSSENQKAVEVNTAPEMIENLSAEDANVSTNIQEVSEAVVGVVNLQQQSIWTDSEEAGTGSGIIYKKEDGKAYVVTNQHVVDGAQQVEVVLKEDERLPAKVLGEDALTDLAVLEIDGDKIQTVAKFGSSEDLVIGETVLAIGNPLGLEFANSVTKGIISGLDRSVTVDTNRDGQADWVTEVLQTDAAINPGNSGGALVNGDGEVIGINSMKIAQSAVEGIGFAIPVNAALPIMEQLEKEGEVSRPQIGIATVSLYQVPPQYRYEINLPEDLEGGMVIANVQPNSPADEAGLQQFDIITKINNHEVTSIVELRKYLYSETTVGDKVEIEYYRNGERQTTSLQLAEMENE